MNEHPEERLVSRNEFVAESLERLALATPITHPDHKALLDSAKAFRELPSDEMVRVRVSREPFQEGF